MNNIKAVIKFLFTLFVMLFISMLVVKWTGSEAGFLLFPVLVIIFYWQRFVKIIW